MANNSFEIPMAEDWDSDAPIGSNYHMSVEEASLLDLYNKSMEGEQTTFQQFYRMHLTRLIRKVRAASNKQNQHNNIWNEAK